MARDGLLGFESEKHKSHTNVNFKVEKAKNFPHSKAYECIPVVLLDLDVFGFGLAPLLLLSDCGFSGDGLSGSDLILTVVSMRPDVVGLDTAGSFDAAAVESFF